MSGVYAQRGFIYQSIIAMIECLERSDWDAIKLEPLTDGDKVDIMLLKHSQILTAIQVKSSKNTFSKLEVERWLNEVKSDAAGANEVILYLVGDSYSYECDNYIRQNSKEIKKAPFNDLEALCFGKLTYYIKSIGLSQDVRLSDLDLIDASLFSKIHRNSIANESLSREAFEKAFCSALSVGSPSVSVSEKEYVAHYYHYIMEKLCEKPEEREASLFGEEPVNTSYIDPYYKDGETRKLLIDGVENWCSQRTYGVMLLHGEPGHGKTSFCRKCVYEFISGNRFIDQKNVFTFSINPARSDILAGSRLKIENAFTWGFGNPLISISFCRSSVIFLDGFDELIDEARNKGLIDSITDFMDVCYDFSKEHMMKIIITSRSMCVRDNLPDVQIRYTTYKFEPLSLKQQVDWIQARKKYEGYLGTFRKINESQTMKKITGIPILFRMIVAMRFDREIDNRAVLYKELFYLTLKRQKYNETIIKKRYIRFEELAYAIFTDNEDTTEIDDIETSAAWIYAYYVKAEGKQRIGFLHRSFYEFFLSSFIISRLNSSLSDKERQLFIELISVRKLTKEYLISIQSVYTMLKNESRNTSDELIKRFQGILDYISSDYMAILRSILNSKTSSAQYIDWAECVFFNINAINYVLNFGLIIQRKELKDSDCATHFDIQIFGRLFGLLNMKGAYPRGNYSSLRVENVHLENSILSAVLLYNANMPTAHFQSGHFVEVIICNSMMKGSILEKASITSLTIKEVDLSYSNFENAVFNKSNIDNVVLAHSNLSGLKINESNFYKTDFSYCIFSGVTMKQSTFAPSCNFDYAFIPERLRSFLEDQGLDLKKVIWIDK